MWRILTLPFLFMLTAAAPTLPTLDQVNEAGRVLATLNDVRVFVFALMFLLFLQTLERWWAGFRAGKTADKFAVAADKLSDAVNAMAAAQAQLALEVRELTRGRP